MIKYKILMAESFCVIYGGFSVKVSTGPAQRKKGHTKTSPQTTRFARSQYSQSALSNR